MIYSHDTLLLLDSSYQPICTASFTLAIPVYCSRFLLENNTDGYIGVSESQAYAIAALYVYAQG